MVTKEQRKQMSVKCECGSPAGWQKDLSFMVWQCSVESAHIVPQHIPQDMRCIDLNSSGVRCRGLYEPSERITYRFYCDACKPSDAVKIPDPMKSYRSLLSDLAEQKKIAARNRPMM